MNLDIKSFIFGYSSSNLPIPAYRFGSGGHEVLILGGVHGDEAEGVVAAHGLLNIFAKDFLLNLTLTLVPMFNIDGVVAKQRKNSNNVDLNRNLATKDWTAEVSEEKYHPGKAPNSEPENQALVKFIKDSHLRFVLSLHSWNPLLNVNGDCLGEAKVLEKLTGYEIKDSIGYPTPGCLGTYCGLERNIPTLTYEIKRGSSIKEILQTHPSAIIEALKITEGRG